MRRPLSLATRLTIFFAVAAAFVFPIFGWVISRSLDEHFAEGDTAELEIIADAVENALSGVHSASDLAPVEHRFDDILVGHHSASLYIGAADGRTVYASSTHLDLSGVARTAAGESGADSVHLWNDGQENYRVLVRRVGQDTPFAPSSHTIVVATPVDYHVAFQLVPSHALAHDRNEYCGHEPMGWIAVQQGHAPLRDIVARIRGSARASSTPVCRRTECRVSSATRRVVQRDARPRR
jgi:two-component system heavy metal sensor histidine kinase CusS